ncbi:MAG: hypothetical protein WA364_20980 [Candidatus Nitrosopolaris sp.]|jgi:alkanesulfonate monooxygenase SsuD/methylene tetrahydromethanopterin reductase-like flavin-dependent oxidoreductase (luciferase family)
MTYACSFTDHFFSKTKLGRVVIEDDRELARKRSQQIISQVVKMPEEQVDEFAIYGTPEDVLRQKELFEEAGIQYRPIERTGSTSMTLRRGWNESRP